MIPLDLVKVRISRGKIKPAFMTAEEEVLAVEVIETFRSCIGMKRGELEERLELLEEIYDYRRVRGLATLLERRCIFASLAEDVWRLRKEVFSDAERMGGVYDEDKRRKVLEAVAKHEGLTPEELENMLWADLDEEKELVHFDAPSSDELIKEYNLSLLQSILLRGLELEFYLERGWRDVLWAAKRLGLMYEAYLRDEGPVIRVQGPASLLRLTERYGSSLAKLLPYIIRHRGWRIRARVVWRVQGVKKYTELELDHDKARPFLPQYPVEPERFDSEVEERFYREFLSLKSGWRISRESEVLIVDSGIYLPDFTLEKGGLKVYLEIMGFWTEEYLRRKLEKLRRLKGARFILAVQEDLACSEIKEVGHRVVVFKDHVRAEDVFKLLNEIEEEDLPKIVSSLLEKGIKVNGDVVELSRIHSSTRAIKEVLKRKPVEGYRLIGEQLVSENLLRLVDEELSKVERYYDAVRIISSHGIKDAASLLLELGYEVVWKSLDGSDAMIRKKNG